MLTKTNISDTPLFSNSSNLWDELAERYQIDRILVKNKAFRLLYQPEYAEERKQLEKNWLIGKLDSSHLQGSITDISDTPSKVELDLNYWTERLDNAEQIGFQDGYNSANDPTRIPMAIMVGIVIGFLLAFFCFYKS